MTIESIIIVDTETTGLDPSTCDLIEVAAVRYDVAHRCVVNSWATLVRARGNAAEAINRIPAAALLSAPGVPELVDATDALDGFIGNGRASVWMAHRAEFDRGFIAASAPGLAARMPWVCSKFDIEWPHSKPGASCVEMALAHGVPVVSAHRALTDCMLIANTLASVGEQVPALLARAMRPRAVFAVRDTSFDAARNELAKANGFRWEKPHWIRRMAVEDAASLPFAVREVSPP